MTNSLSRTISALRTVLCMFIVNTHMSLTSLTWQDRLIQEFPLYDSIVIFFDILFRCALPLFFFISGYLFFLNFTLTGACYKSKMKRRVKRLLQPIVVWTTLYLSLYYVGQSIPYTATLFSGQNKLIADYDWSDLLTAYTGTYTRVPFAGQFWYLRNLFVVCLFSPLIWVLFRYTRSAVLILTGIVWYFTSFLHINYQTIDSLFFFMLGGYAGWLKVDLLELFHKRKTLVYILFPLTWIGSFLLAVTHSSWQSYVYRIYTLVSFPFLFNLAAPLMGKRIGEKLLLLSGGSYFCFLLHQQLLMFIKRFVAKIIHTHEGWMLLCLHYLIPVVVIFLCYVLYSYLKKASPALLNILVGNEKGSSS